MSTYDTIAIVQRHDKGNYKVLEKHPVAESVGRVELERYLQTAAEYKKQDGKPTEVAIVKDNMIVGFWK